jgi:hypothetical protein
MTKRLASLFLLLAALQTGACYETPKPNCAFLCGEGGACPEGYQCSAEDDRCHLVLPGGGLAVCEMPLPPDAARADAPVDGAIDAPGLDAGPPDVSVPDVSTPDVMPGPPDAMPGPPDAMPGPPDASPPDAMPGAPDASPPDAFVCAPTLAPVSDGSAPARRALMLSEINPDDYIELYNNTAAPIDLDSSPFWFCSPFTYSPLAGTGVTVPAGGYATVPWPSGFTDADAGGEVILYLDANFTDPLKIMDFVCWGTNPHGTRITEATIGGKWNSTMPSSCAPVLAAGAIHRNVMTDGVNAADYDTTSPPSPMNCTP